MKIDETKIERNRGWGRQNKKRIQILGRNMWVYEEVEYIVNDGEMWKEGMRVVNPTYVR